MPWETIPYVEEGPQPYRMENHSWKITRFISWPVCQYCGLVLLRNPFSKWCADKGCNYKDHPGYAGQRDRAHV